MTIQKFTCVSADLHAKLKKVALGISCFGFISQLFEKYIRKLLVMLINIYFKTKFT